MFDNVDDSYWFFSKLLSDIISEHAPVKTKILKRTQVPYMNSALRKSISQGEWTRNSRFVAPNLRGALPPSRFGCDESTCFASILRLKKHSDMQLVILFLLLIQMHMITSEVGQELSTNSCLSVCHHVYSKSSERIWTKFYVW